MSLPDPPKIPPDLVENIVRGSCVLFLGADDSFSTDSWIGPPSRAQLAAALADKYDWVTSRDDLRLAAEEFLSRDPPDYHGLVTFVQELVSACVEPGPIHQALVDLGFDAIVTNGYDDLVEVVMRQAGRRILKVVGDAEIAYAGNKEETILIHLMGTISQPNSLVLTSRDQIQIENHLSEKLQAVRGWCSLRPLLFIGWDPEDDSLRRLYYAATERLGRHKRRNYIVWPNPSARAVANWKVDNVEIIPADPLTFLGVLQRAVAEKRLVEPGYRPGEIVGKLPYKFLNYFVPEDRDIFCGREVEAPLVCRMALSCPMLTLFGQSGVGKTSLLLAGVVPLLIEEGYDYAYIRALGDPLQAIRQGVCEALSLPGCEGETLYDFFRVDLGQEGRLVVILDQFEEVFVRASTSKKTRKQFWREVSECLSLTNPEVHFVLCLREDFLAELDEARRPLDEGESAPVPTILRDSYRLTSLVTDAAYLAIVEPARRARCTVEPRLTDLLLGREYPPDLEKSEGSRWSLAEADGTVPPPSLQIVMDRLYRQALVDVGYKSPIGGAGDKTWRPPILTLTLDQYQALGGAGSILAEYVTSGLDEVPMQGGDRAAAMTLLKVMVTSQATKAVLDDAEMIAEMTETDPDFDADDAQAVACARATRAALVNLRLVRSFKMGERVLYELAHDHMAAEIATWISQDEMQAKLTRDLLRRELDSWRSLGKLVEPEALRLIHERRDALRRLGADESELLLRSALAAGYEVPYWRERAPAVIGKVEHELFDGLASENSNRAQQAVAGLVALASSSIINRLAELIEADFASTSVIWVDRKGKEHPVRHTVLNVTTVRQQRAMRALTKIALPNATEALARWTPPGMVLISAGPFTMGSTEEDREKPVHEACLDTFWIDCYPVTNAQWAAYLKGKGWQQQELWTDSGWTWKLQEHPEPDGWNQSKRKLDHPVQGISWYEALAYARWAGKCLLSEAQWEKAARGTDGRRYPWGDGFDECKCNTSESGIGGTTPVGKYSPAGDSPYGVADMAGNVWEWCRNLDVPYPYNDTDGREVLEGTGYRVLRGGSFCRDSQYARTAYRNYVIPNFRYNLHGVRVGVADLFLPLGGMGRQI